MKSRIMKPFCKSLNCLSSKLKKIINLKVYHNNKDLLAY